MILEKIEKFATSTYGSRKFMFVLAVFGVATAALYFHVATFDRWSDVIKWIGGTFLSGHALADAAASLGARINPQPTIPLQDDVPRRA